MSNFKLAVLKKDLEKNTEGMRKEWDNNCDVSGAMIETIEHIITKINKLINQDMGASDE